MSADGQRTKWCRNIAENFNRLSRAHERYRQTDRQTTDDRQTDGRPMTYSERELVFTFAKNRYVRLPLLCLTPQTEGFPWDDLYKIFSERELKFTFVICHRPSVCLSVTFVRPTQAIEIFGNVSTPLPSTIFFLSLLSNIHGYSW